MCMRENDSAPAATAQWLMLGVSLRVLLPAAVAVFLMEEEGENALGGEILAQVKSPRLSKLINP